MLAIALIMMFILLALGVPVAICMGLSGVIAVVVTGAEPLTAVLKRVVVGLDSFPLLACPFFIFAGDLMTRGGISRRIVSFSNSVVGFVRGGLGMVDVLASMIFAGISGSATADASAIGSIMIPQLIESKYPRGFAAALEAVSGSIGMIIPPSMIMIIYGSIANESIGKLFMGGLVPGILFGTSQMLIVYIYATKWGWKGSGKFRISEIYHALKQSFLALVMPLIIIGGILFGVFTATEAGAVAAVYGLFVGTFVYKEINLKRLYEALIASVEITGYVMFMIASAGIMSHIFTIEQVPEKLVSMLLSITSDQNVILLIILGAIIFAGFFLEMFPMLVILVPVLVPVARQFGFDPVQFGVLVCIANVMGGVTPPVGGLIFVTMGIAKAEMSDLIKYIYPFILLMVLILVLGVFFPGIITFIPNSVFVK